MRFLLFSLLIVLTRAVTAQEGAETQNPFWQNEYCINPSVPYTARLEPREGSATLLFDIKAEGKTHNIRVVEASAADGDQKLARAFARGAKQALKRWEYFAYIKDSAEAPRFDVPITFNFVAKESMATNTSGNDAFSNRGCTTSVLPEPPSHAGDPADPYTNLQQCLTPNMPRRADKEKRSGQASMTFDVNKKGRLKNIKHAARQDENEFTKEAARVLKHWRYKPYLTAGEPTYRENVMIDFVFGDVPSGAGDVSCTQVNFGTSRTLDVAATSRCEIKYNEGIPVPSKGCMNEVK